MSKTPKPEFARFCRVLGRTRLLFRSLAQRQRRQNFDVRWASVERGGGACHCTGPEKLGSNDLRVLLAVMALGHGKQRRLSANPKTKEGKRLRAALRVGLDAVDDDGAVVAVSFRAIATVANYKDPDCTARIKECLERLSNVVVEHHDPEGKAGQYRMLAFVQDDAGRLSIALNPLLNQVLTGGQFMLIDMREFSKLEGDLEFLLHFALCASIDAGKSLTINRNTLAGYIWTPGAGREALKKRLQRLEAPIDKLRSIGWRIDEVSSASDKRAYKIHRPGG